MLSLFKIKEINGYRFFNQFKWDEHNCKPFVQNNLIYGWNGSGKTTLCDFFKEIEVGELSDQNISFALMFRNTVGQDFTTIKRSQLGSIPYRIRVYYQEYARENVTKVDNVRHIFAVGKKQRDKIDELHALKAEEQIQVASIKKKTGELQSTKQSFEQRKTEIAKQIRTAANYTQAYNKNAFYAAFKKIKSPARLSDTEYQSELSSVRAEKRNAVPVLSVSFIQPTVKEYIKKILQETPVNATIEALKKDPPVSAWVEEGLQLYHGRESETCFFCGGLISKERITELEDHFNQSYRHLSTQIDSAVLLLKQRIQQFRDAKATFPNLELLYPELRSEYESSYESACSVCDLYIRVLEQVAEVVAGKKSNMIDTLCVDTFDQLIASLSFDYSAFEQLNSVIERHNKKTEAFQQSIQAAQKRIEQHILSEVHAEVTGIEDDIAHKEHELDADEEKLNQLRESLRALEASVKNSQIPADAINSEIAFIMGRSELVFSNTELGYTITRKGKPAKNLSKGEENAIALIYFFNTLLDVDEDKENTIVFLDDPISSFDSNFYYNAISYIRDKTNDVGQTFIFTHKFSLYKDYSLMYRSDTNKYVIKRIGDMPRLVDEDKTLSQFHDEYVFLFKKIYDFVKNPPENMSEYLQYPNIGRRLLEGYLTFKLPRPSNECTMIDKVMILEKGHNTAAGRAVLRLLNNHSHFQVIPNGESADEIDSLTALPNVLGQLLEFMRYHDRVHYDTLARYCDERYSGERAAVEIEEHFQKIVKLYSMPSSAGTGNSLESEIPFDTITVTNPDCSFAIKISGDSMEPEYPNGCIVLVRQCEVIPPARIGIIWYDGRSYCKKVVQNGNKTLLVSLNRQYSPIEVTLDDYKVFGEVIEIYSTDS